MKNGSSVKNCAFNIKKIASSAWPFVKHPHNLMVEYRLQIFTFYRMTLSQIFLYSNDDSGIIISDTNNSFISVKSKL